jgi:large subunit ribosomal protein L15
MQLHTLKPKTKRKVSKQVGRGGTRGKTSGKGTKGQNARAGHKKRPEIRDFIKRIPKLRGRGVSSLKSFQDKPLSVNLDTIDKVFQDGQTVNIDALVSAKIISLKSGKASSIKILAGGANEFKKNLVFEGVLASEAAKEAIEKARGKII